jgi:phosphatidate cytidylyltransferase
VLRARLATAAVAIPLLLYLVFLAPFFLYRSVVLAFTVLALMEYFHMAFPGRPGRQAWGVGAGALVAFAIANASETSPYLFSGVLTGIVVAELLATLLRPGDPGGSVGEVGRTILGVLYGGALLPHLVWLRVRPEDTGAVWVAFVLAVAMGGDSAGYFAGRLWGRRPLLPQVSPKKTVEGAFGAVGGNLLAGSVVKLFGLPGIGWGETLLLAFASGVLAQLGDLCESLLKRAFGAKDSGWVLPGHGGVLDRTDSLVFPAVLVYYYVNLLRVAP